MYARVRICTLKDDQEVFFGSTSLTGGEQASVVDGQTAQRT